MNPNGSQMSGFDIYIFIVVPGVALLISGLAILVQRRAEKNVQKHVDRLAELRSKEGVTNS